MTDDDVRSALDLLSRRADGHLAPDRLPAVRRRARRAAQVRTAALAAAAVVVVGAAGTLVRGGDLRGSGPAVTPSAVAPHLEVEVTPETDPVVLDAVASGPYGSNGFRLVVLQVRLRGTVPAARDGAAPYGLRDTTGDGSYSGSDSPDCAPDAQLVTLDKVEAVTVTYAPDETLSSDTVTITVSACSLDPVVRRITVQIPPAATPSG